MYHSTMRDQGPQTQKTQKTPRPLTVQHVHDLDYIAWNVRNLRCRFSDYTTWNEKILELRYLDYATWNAWSLGHRYSDRIARNVWSPRWGILLHFLDHKKPWMKVFRLCYLERKNLEHRHSDYAAWKAWNLENMFLDRIAGNTWSPGHRFRLRHLEGMKSWT